MNNIEWARMKYMVCSDFSANMYETEASAVEALNKGEGLWLFAITLRELPTKVVERTVKQLTVDHPQE